VSFPEILHLSVMAFAALAIGFLLYKELGHDDDDLPPPPAAPLQRTVDSPEGPDSSCAKISTPLLRLENGQVPEDMRYHLRTLGISPGQLAARSTGWPTLLSDLPTTQLGTRLLH